jgi:putative acetyltransferase
MNDQSVTIRPEQPTDLAAIHALNAASFPAPGEARLVDLLRDAGRLQVSLVADAGLALVGHVAFSAVTTATGIVGTGLAPLAVLESHRRRGIAESLVRTGLEACRSAGIGWVVVLGDPTYYGRFGFQPASTFGLVDEYGGGGAFQALELIPGQLPRGAGLVRYAPEFATVG